MSLTLSDPQIVDGFFTEREVLWPGQRFGLQVKNVLHREKSEFQVSIPQVFFALCGIGMMARSLISYFTV